MGESSYNFYFLLHFFVFLLWQFTLDLNVTAVNSPQSSFSSLPPATLPASSPIPAHDLFGSPFRDHHHVYKLTLIPGIGILITGVAILLLFILVLLIHRKNKQLKKASSSTRSTFDASSCQHVWKNEKGTSIVNLALAKLYNPLAAHERKPFRSTWQNLIDKVTWNILEDFKKVNCILEEEARIFLV